MDSEADEKKGERMHDEADTPMRWRSERDYAPGELLALHGFGDPPPMKQAARHIGSGELIELRDGQMWPVDEEEIRERAGELPDERRIVYGKVKIRWLGSSSSFPFGIDLDQLEHADEHDAVKVARYDSELLFVDIEMWAEERNG